MIGTMIADDLTGACDAAAPFAAAGPVGVFVAPDAPSCGWSFAAIDTESRGLDPAEAADRVRAALEGVRARLHDGLLFKKIDSTLRGPVGTELEALLSESGRRAALVCPAFPDQARTVVRDVLLVNGQPAHESPIGRDPAYPGATSAVTEIVRRGAARPVRHLSLAQVRGGPEGLRAALAAAGDRIVVADAETDGDLERLAGAALGAPQLVLAGSAGLARAAAVVRGHLAEPVPVPRGGGWLIVAGSTHPATRAQIGALEAAGVPGARVGDGFDPDTGPLAAHLETGQPVFVTTVEARVSGLDARSALAARLGLVAARILVLARPAAVAVTGGETAVALLRAAGVTRIEVVGAPSSGLALGDAVPRAAPRFSLLTKAGGFGPPDLFVALLGLARRREAPIGAAPERSRPAPRGTP
jgi:uncharacterized protein YgbK (DUF1537 family)